MNSFRFVEQRDRVRDRAPDRRRSTTAARSCRRRACGTPTASETRSMRSKEEAHDYRYFPEPDLLPLDVDRGVGRRGARATLPELPGRAPRALRRATTASPPYDADVLTAAQGRRRLLRGRRRRARATPKAIGQLGHGRASCASSASEKLDDALVIRDWPVAPTQLARAGRAWSTTARSAARSPRALLPRAARHRRRTPTTLVARRGARRR